ncbi:MAG: restriction endonuclease subunit S [Cyanobium sp.]
MEGWETKPLGEICIVDWGNTDLTKSSYVEGGKYLAVSAAGCDGRIDHMEHVKFTPVLSAIGAQCGRMFLPEEDFTAIKNTITLTPRDDIFTGRFLYQLLSHVELPKRGSAQPFISKGDIQSFQVPVPPLAEQQRIVQLLDDAFAELATAQAHAERNLQNARALFESHLQSVFTERGEGWVEKSLGEICEMYQPQTIGTKDLIPGGPYPVFGANGVIGRYNNLNHEEPQLLVTCRGATCGSVNISEPKSWITGNAMVIRPLDDSLDLKFLEFIFRGGIDISQAITGSAQPQITRTNLSPVLIGFPKSAAEQKRLAEQFHTLAEETQRLAGIYERKLSGLAALKKSLLHQAFNGDL